MDTIIPFNRPFVSGREFEYIEQAIKNNHMSGDGPFTHASQDRLQNLFGGRKVLLTTSATHALEMAAMLLRLGVDDEVIIPSFSYPSTATAFALRGAKVRFADIDPSTLNIDPGSIESLISPRTQAILVVHYAGVPCEMARIMALADRHDIRVIEDCAHGPLAKINGQSIGTFGCLSALSFHETKNLSCGEGGALVINDSGFSSRAEVIRQKGTNRKAFEEGLVDRYTLIDLGSSYGLSDLLAAYLLAQLESYELIQTKRERIWENYESELRGWAETFGVKLPQVPQGCLQSFHMFHLIFCDEAQRTRALRQLREVGIGAVFHYQPLHESPLGTTLADSQRPCPVSRSVAARILRLPFFTGMSQSEQQRVIDSILSLQLD